MGSICNINCLECPTKDECAGCEQTCGKPFGGRCIAAEYIKVGGHKQYDAFKQQLLAEINMLLESLELPNATKLYELAGRYVNLEYTLPSGEKVRLLDDKNIYLGCQIEFADLGVCYGVVADTGFILICSYGLDGSDPEIVIYKRR